MFCIQLDALPPCMHTCVHAWGCHMQTGALLQHPVLKQMAFSVSHVYMLVLGLLVHAQSFAHPGGEWLPCR
jgi:hypothetical protein